MNFETQFLIGLFFAGIFILFWDLLTHWNEYFGTKDKGGDKNME